MSQLKKKVTSEEVERVLTAINDPILIMRVGRKLYNNLRKSRRRYEKMRENGENCER